jgi:dihydroorotase
MGASTGDLLVDDPVALESIFREVPRLIAVHAEDEARIRSRTALFAGRTDAQLISAPKSLLLRLIRNQNSR